MRTGVPGVWEEVARGIKERTEQDKSVEPEMQPATRDHKARKGTVQKANVADERKKRPIVSAVKRQTARSSVKRS